MSIGQVGGTYDDKPRQGAWVSYDKRYRVRVVKMYYIVDDGIWQFCEFTKGGYLKAGVSPWLDDDGKPEHEYSWRSAYVDRDNNRYGPVRDMVDPADKVTVVPGSAAIAMAASAALSPPPTTSTC